jgi:PAS domain-containing protein
VTFDTEPVRRWVRVVAALRARRLKIRRTDGAAAAALDALLTEALDVSDSLMQELAGAHLESQRLQREVHAEAVNRQHLFDQVPMACLATDETGLIQNANPTAAELFNVSARHLRDRQLLHFAADRDAFALMLRALPFDDSQLQAVMRIRPRERSLSKLNARVVAERSVAPGSWLWFLTPAVEVSAIPRSEKQSA